MALELRLWYACAFLRYSSWNKPLKAPTRFNNDIVIIDENEPCPYLPDETARMPLRMPVGKISLTEADERLAVGHRRTGEFVYKTKCPNCEACLPVRIDCLSYQFSKNQLRVMRRNDTNYRTQIGPLVADGKRVALFNRHRRLRGLAKRDHDIDLEEYIWGFVRSCFDSFELTYWDGDDLVCVAICDRGRTSLSAVYTFFEPEIRKQGLGTYSILKQIQYCQDRELAHLYLGFYVANSPHMTYKKRFVPQERLINGQWIRIESIES